MARFTEKTVSVTSSVGWPLSFSEKRTELSTTFSFLSLFRETPTGGIVRGREREEGVREKGERDKERDGERGEGRRGERQGERGREG